ncbi:hypothetical protein QJS10_CPA08g00715 [Acorus calamus]|uniref:Uncharacterized protein n=1 Tax=Acorus calamus TaxID=4465 RepID=A0AAV9E8K3_ACOCL|nr:hypothetical protein QJS10_CPA08g00715 [Acorus calamus]
MLTWTARKLSTCSFRPSKHIRRNPTKTSQNPNTIFISSLRFSSSSSSNSPILKETTNNGAAGGSSLSCLCPGCGVSMQDTDPKLPGFFTKPSPKNPSYRAHHLHRVPVNVESDEEPKKPVVCARCHSLRHYGKVKCAEVGDSSPASTSIGRSGGVSHPRPAHGRL